MQSSNLSLDKYIQNSSMVYTMPGTKIPSTKNTQRTNKKVLPIKLEPSLYQDLKLVSQESGMPMAVIIREFLQKKITAQATQIREQKNKSIKLSEFYERNAYKGKIYHADKTIDQLLYEEQL